MLKRHNTSSIHTFLSFIILVTLAIYGSLAKAASATPVSPPKLSLGNYDHHTQWAWQPVKIGAGGWVRGMVIHPANGAIRYARSDTWGAYRWDVMHSLWVPMLTTQSIGPNIKATSSYNPSQTYTLTGFPSESGTDSIALDPQNQSRVYVSWGVTPTDDNTGGTNPSSGNVFYSNDYGRTFAASTGLTSLASRHCTNPGSTSLYDTDQELYAHNYGGETLSVDPRNSNVIYLGSRLNGVFISANAARSFSAVTSGGIPSGCSSIANVLFDGKNTIQRTINGGPQTVSKTIYVVVSYQWVNNQWHGSVFQSTDGGVNWNDIAVGYSDITSHEITHSIIDQTGTFWIASNNKLSRYDGSKFIPVNTPTGVQSVAVDPNNPLRIFTVDFVLNAARSTDGGQNWTNLSLQSGKPLHVRSSDGINWIGARLTRPYAHGAFLFDPGIGTAGGLGRLWVSNGNDGTIYADLKDSRQIDPDHGLSWFEKSKGIEQLVSQNVLLPPGNHNSAVMTAEDEAAFYISNPRLFNAKRYDINTAAGGNNDLATNGMAAFIPDTPSVVVTIPANLFQNPQGANFPGYSVNYGQNWTLFPSIQQSDSGSFNTPDPTLVGGQIAISARGNVLPMAGKPIWTGQDNLVWLPVNVDNPNVAPRYSLDGAKTWQSGAIFNEDGTPKPFGCVPKSQDDPECPPFQYVFNTAAKQFAVVADPLTPKTFYAATTSIFMRTTDGGKTWNVPPGTQSAFSGGRFFINVKMTAVPGRSGDLWIATGSGDPGTAGKLYHSIDGGSHWQLLTLAKAYNVAVGKGAPGKDYALYMYGLPDNGKVYGVYRSDDHGASWYLISGDGTNGYPDHNFNQPSDIAASPDVEGLVYLSLRGQSMVWGFQRSLGNPYPVK